MAALNKKKLTWKYDKNKNNNQDNMQIKHKIIRKKKSLEWLQ